MSAILHVSGPETTQAPTVTRFGYQAEIQIIFGTVYKKDVQGGGWDILSVESIFN